MKRILLFVICALVISPSCHLQGQISINAMTTFRNDGWFAPGEGGYTFLGTGSNERGLAYGGNGHLYLVSRTGGNNIRVLDAYTGLELSSLNLGSSVISGGLYPVNTVGVGGDGAIYVANMTTAAPANGNFKVYS